MSRPKVPIRGRGGVHGALRARIEGRRAKERAYRAAMTADLDAWRGVGAEAGHRTQHQLSRADRTALARLRPFNDTEAKSERAA